MSVNKCIDIIIKNIVLIILITTIMTSITAYIVVYRTTPIYESTASVYIVKNDSGEQYSDITVVKQLVKDYKKLITSRLIIDSVAENLGLTENDASNIMENISVSQLEDSNVIQLKVRDKDADNAKIIAQKFINVFVEKISDITNFKNIEVKEIDTPNLPQNPVNAKKSLDIVIAFLLGISASLGIVFLKEYFDNTLKTTEDVEKYLKLRVLAVIPVKNIRE